MNNLHFRLTYPFSRINDQLPGLTRSQRSILDKHFSKFQGKSYFDVNFSKKGQNAIFPLKEDFFCLSLIYLITETVGEYPYPYLTEKTWKAIVNQRPFMILGSMRSLSLLKDMGFKTFDKWWDESYDLKENTGDRIDGIVDQLVKLSTLSETDLLTLENEMLPTVSYNLKHLKTFQQRDLQNIANLI
jgi:hypothetical protein